MPELQLKKTPLLKMMKYCWETWNVIENDNMVEDDEIKQSKISIKLFYLFVLSIKNSRCYYWEFVLYFIF